MHSPAYSNEYENTDVQLLSRKFRGLKAVDLHGPRSGHPIDRTQTVYATTDGTTWTPIGIPYATNTFHGVESRAPNDVIVSAGGGSSGSGTGYRWTPKHTGDDALRDVERGYSGPNGLACGADGTIQRYDGTWNTEQTPTDETLLGVARGKNYQSNQIDIAVGEHGTILEKKRSRPSQPGGVSTMVVSVFKPPRLAAGRTPFGRHVGSPVDALVTLSQPLGGGGRGTE